MVSEKYLIIFLLAPLFFSGCTIPFLGSNPFNSNTPQGTGVIIMDFGPDIQGDINSKERVTFAVKVKNTGSVKAEKCFAELLGLDYAWKPDPAGVLSGSGELFPNEVNCKYTERKINLLPEDLERGTTGEETVCSWTYIAPEVKTGLDIQSNARVRFYYNYKSSTIKSITLLSRDELKSIQNQGKGLPMESASSTKSPISLEIQSASPIKIYENRAEFPIIITIKNIGGGTVCIDRSGDGSENCKKKGGLVDDKELNRFKLRIRLPEGMSLDTTTCREEEEIVMVGSSQQILSCQVIGQVDKMIGVAQKNIKLEANYGYFIDKTVAVRVVPSNLPGSGGRK